MAFSEKANLSLLPKTTKKTMGVFSKSIKKPKRSPPPHLPLDIICDILSRQHVKTLCKSRCVSKSWLAQISDTNFRRSHRRRSKDKPLLLLTTFSPHSNTLNFYSFDTKGGDLVSKTSNSQHTMSSSVSGVLSCLELVCIHHDSEDEPQQVYICNPATGEVVALPEEETSFEEGGEHIHNHVAFGCVPSTGEYIVLRIFFRWSVDDIELGAEVFALRVDSEGGCRATGDGWRDVCEPPCYFRGDAAFVGGAIYFLPDYGLYEYGSTSGVAQFDLVKEEWSVIPLPAEKYLVPKDPLSLSLREVGGKLCLVDHGESPRKLLNMWLLQDMDKGVWVKAYSIDLSPLTCHCVSPLAITEDERVLVEGSGKKMLAYDPNSKRFEDLDIEKRLSCEETGECYFATTLYVESFISLGRE